MSLVYGISMGISTVVGSVTPLIMVESSYKGTSALLFFGGLALTLIGVVVVTMAGIKRDGGARGSAIGVALSIFSGLGSGFMNVGLTKNSSLLEPLEALGYYELAVSAARWLPVLVGGCVAGLLYCIGEVTVKKQWHTVTAKSSAPRALKLFGVSIIWYAALILYGYATFRLDNIDSTVGWVLFNALALIISVLWKLKTGEWKGSKKTLLFTGCFILIVARIIVSFV